MEKIKEYLERNSKVIIEIIEDSETYKIEDISILTKLNCEIAEVFLRIVGDKNGIIQTSKTSTRTDRKSK